MPRVQRYDIKSDIAIIGSNKIAFDENGIAEVSQEVYESLRGLKKYVLLGEDDKSSPAAPESQLSEASAVEETQVVNAVPEGENIVEAPVEQIEEQPITPASEPESAPAKPVRKPKVK